MEFKIVCNKCKLPVTEDPLLHVVNCYNIIDLFTLVPALNWNDFAQKPKPKKSAVDVAEAYANIKLPKKEVDEDEEA